jgi:cyclopropane fatty-acyl-phospholipid synthase-like methyltransferase
VSNNTFNFMLGPLGIKSVLDIGCGKGVSTSRFRELGAKVLCVEGSHDACTHSLLPAQLVVEHDYSRGPWWPEDTYDAAWAVEFLEHVGRQHMANYVATMRRAALVFVTHSAWGGWHHVEVHSDMWWTGR